MNMVYITAKDRKEAVSIAKELVETKLAACVNIIDKVTSVYRWEGKVNEDTEVVMIAKTRPELVQSLIKKVMSLHSYSCPCVVSWPITEGNKDFLKWVSAETQ